MKQIKLFTIQFQFIVLLDEEYYDSNEVWIAKSTIISISETHMMVKRFVNLNIEISSMLPIELL